MKSILAAMAMAILSSGAIPTSVYANGLPEVTAADTVRVAPSKTATIYKHGRCRRVNNNGSDPILVPLSTRAEWVGNNGFISNVANMAGISVSKCAPTGYDLVFCYYTMNTGGYGAYCGPTSQGTGVPRVIYTAGVFDTSHQALIGVMGIAGENQCDGFSFNANKGTNMFFNPQAVYNDFKNQINWSSGRDWCFVRVTSSVSDHEMAGGDSGSGRNTATAFMRVWNPSAN